ncbi:MAG: VRR-NUC domain-containing protein [Reyranella sp.]|uniref:VRR-NUC domain-containing protein n=1 Tax=Reyranella sp. TaxID=1929291 RepID=UPI003D11AE51
MKEKSIQNAILASLGARRGVRLFRQPVAHAWVGQFVERIGDMVKLRNAQRIFAGLCVGSSDIVGWQSVEVTPEMVGSKLAVFTAIEVKKPRGDRREEQVAFVAAVRKDGGRAGFARSVAEAEAILTGANDDNEQS